MKKFADLGLREAAGYGVWTLSANVSNENWDAAEDFLVQMAQDAIAGPRGGKIGGYHVFRDNGAKTLRLDLMRGGSDE